MAAEQNQGQTSSRRRTSRIERRPLYEEAVDAIRTAILRGDFQPGGRLEEPELAEFFGLSRGPVREALRKLEQEGIVVSSPHHGASVVTLDDVELADAMALREYVETLHCDRVVEAITDDAIADLEAILRQMQLAVEADDMVAVAETDFAFHASLIGVGRSNLARRVWRSIAGQLRMSLALSDPVFLQQNGDIVATHEPILAGLRLRDAKQLDKALREHMVNVTPLLRKRGH